MAAVPELRFDALCRTARVLFAVPAVTVHRTDGGGRWASLDDGAWAAVTAPGVWPDDPVVTEDGVGHPPVRFFACVPFGRCGTGRLCLYDIRPRRLDAHGRAALDDLAALAGQSLDLFRDACAAAGREADFRLLAETSTDTIVRGDLDGVRLYISPSVRTLLGYEPEELIGRRAAELVHPDDAPPFSAMMRRVRAGDLDIGVTEMRQRHKDGSWVWMEASVRLTHDPLSGEANGYVASVRGVAERKRTEARLEHLASHDPLTGLPNRALLARRLEEAIAGARDGRQPFALLCMDLDRFKPVNDTHGHQAGDAVLREVAARLRAVTRPSDTVARLGGDEFAVIHPIKASPAEAAAVAERLIQAVAQPFRVGDAPVSIGLSIGIVCAPVGGLDPGALLSAADRALYDAKTVGRSTYRFAGSRQP
ncbi:diguanylate cyclase (GGDEF)-like protein/PAS domain S-box-containing protein [Azospirillum fermentarium]|uniref:diguanylate cyclase domain-containing protein n=1 Tax=Azospirillum fermentarium TaxID=1233114 RepID=UPI002226CC80|nr:diguanylate cyclase [Azospirillum fermentarium]MCW2244592.1 diguanylate cyclase (GGDEF)-like protein/PAS domain S-box-containing protein [Azospirillum fermentarium]